MVFNEFEGGSGHNEYLILGNNAQSLTVYTESVENGVDLSELPIIKRGDGVAQTVVATLTNGVGITNPLNLVFEDIEDPEYRTGPITAVADSYAEYSLERVAELFGELSSPNMFDSGGNRAHAATIPHATFTCHAYGVGSSQRGGLRFTAITKRHLVGVAHYGYTVGQVVEFRTVENTPVFRTVVAVWSGWNYNPGAPIADFSVTLLDSDLPSSIVPAPVVGDWINQIQSGATDSTFTFCPQFYGICLWNNDGHITPIARESSKDIVINNGIGATVDGISVSWLSARINNEGYGIRHTEHAGLNYQSSASDFHHIRRAGDSGSPQFVPVAEGWALSNVVDSSLWTAPKINAAIAAVDSIAGISTGYTVTVAPDPTI